jgi:hypothetical protein
MKMSPFGLFAEMINQPSAKGKGKARPLGFFGSYFL